MKTEGVGCEATKKKTKRKRSRWRMGLKGAEMAEIAGITGVVGHGRGRDNGMGEK